MKHYLILITWVGLLLCASTLLGDDSNTSSNSRPRKIGDWDRTCADWDGIDPEVYVLMKDADSAMTDLIRAAAICTDANKGKETVAEKIDQMVKDRIKNTLLDVVADYNPAVAPIKLLSEGVMKGTRGWLDWSIRKQVDRYYGAYREAYTKTKDPLQALATADRWVDDQLEITTDYALLGAYTTMKKWNTLLHVWVFQAHRSFHPDLYVGISLKAKNLNGTNTVPRDVTAKPRDVTPVPRDVTPGPRDVMGTSTPPDPSEPGKRLKTEMVNYPSGKPYYAYTYYEKNGVEVKHGTYTAWHENGKESMKGEHRDGFKEGAWTSWYDNGQKNWIYQYEHGQIVGEEKWWLDGSPMK